jgi:hypothetical protein
VTYPNGTQSAYFSVLINTASTTTLQSGFPTNAAYSGNPPQPGWIGWKSVYQWTLKDLYGNVLSGTDVNETFGTWTYDYAGTNWPLPTPTAGYNPTSNCTDTLSATGTGYTPPMQNPQTPLGTTAVYHDTPWHFYVFSTTSGSGVSIHSDTQQFWQDHGTHSAP